MQNKRNVTIPYEIRGFHGGEEDDILLGFVAV
jgi:bifunctional DNA-binding transcriptional regulator/antitoxin component of YhaV-PrlF toxin-antitoxin module